MKRFNVYSMGAQPDHDDIEENEHGRWVEAEEVAEAERELDELVEWACPVARDLGFVGGLNTIRRTMQDERATIARLERELAAAKALLDRHMRYTVEDRDDLLDETKAFLERHEP